MKPTRASCEPVHSRDRVLHLLKAVQPLESTLRYCEFLLQKVPPERLCGRKPSALAAGLLYKAQFVEWCSGLCWTHPTQAEVAGLFDTTPSSVRSVLRRVLEGLEYPCGIGNCRKKFDHGVEASRHRFHTHRVKDPTVYGCLECGCMFTRYRLRSGMEQEREHLIEVHMTPKIIEGLRAVLGREPNLFEVDNELRKEGI